MSKHRDTTATDSRYLATTPLAKLIGANANLALRRSEVHSLLGLLTGEASEASEHDRRELVAALAESVYPDDARMVEHFTKRVA